MKPAKVTPRWSELVPVLPATVWPWICALVPVPESTTVLSMSTAIQAVDAEKTRRCSWLACPSQITLSSLSLIPRTEIGSM